jgi:hypothetical protein
MTTPKLARAKQSAKKFFFSDTQAMALAMSTATGRGQQPYGGNVVGIGVGPKLVGGTRTVTEESVHVYVRVKLHRSQIGASDLIPPEFGGIPTDIIEVGDVTAFAGISTSRRFSRNRPTDCGVSIGHPSVTAGTMGCLVEKNGNHYILSNNHVLANSTGKGSMGLINNASRGDAIIQPGSLDGGVSPTDDIAKLDDFQLLDFTGAPNLIDAAIASIDQATTIAPDIIDIGRVVQPSNPAKLYQSVRKHGRTTGHTIGVVFDTSVDLWVSYHPHGRAWFENQIMIMGVGASPFSTGGDSGSLIVDAVTVEPVGLLFAGGTTQTFANPIANVLSYFGVSIV